MTDPEYSKSMEAKGSNVHALTPEETRQFLREQDARFAALIRNTGAK